MITQIESLNDDIKKLIFATNNGLWGAVEKLIKSIEDNYINKPAIKKIRQDNGKEKFIFTH